jgi:predicted hydrocarbon binding protein
VQFFLAELFEELRIVKLMQSQKIFHIELLTLFTATLIALVFTSFLFFLPQYSQFFLYIEIVILPSIYVIGYTYAKYEFQRKYFKDVDQLRKETIEVNKKYYKERELCIYLGRELEECLKR